ncbi:MAG: hypothetical protein ABIN91_00940 [Mucilaginibacter sp.]|uniref:hypothetical protein n=1 Tax=Mucilaginibacter sp. TaxID=1882438 RepID=UPI0032652458
MKTALTIVISLLACTAVMAQTGTATGNGTNSSIKIRTSNLVKDKPMFIIFAASQEISRGSMADTSALHLVNPADIESISVLKDKTAETKYGWEGINGVVEIHLKDGKFPAGYIKPEVKKG